MPRTTCWIIVNYCKQPVDSNMIILRGKSSKGMAMGIHMAR